MLVAIGGANYSAFYVGCSSPQGRRQGLRHQQGRDPADSLMNAAQAVLEASARFSPRILDHLGGPKCDSRSECLAKLVVGIDEGDALHERHDRAY
jgi:hypothetical protein